MKTLIKIPPIVFGLLSMLFHPDRCKAQSQELQQLLLNVEKLTQLKSILTDMKTGYEIYQQGYGAISGLSKGNFDLHNLYLGSLMTISPAVRNYGRITDIFLMQTSLISEYKRANHLFRESGVFNASELIYISDVYAKLVSGSLSNILELTNVVTSGKLRMSDAERIDAIDRLYTDMQDRLQFLRVFNRQGAGLNQQRIKEKNDNHTLRGLYGITNYN